ncbi:type I DNA topoisomerase [Candidatus Uhrbacteria bacterium]|nr:type I DNA topoisomerase [Candidatus Uhrbacteria bacterium]
MPAPHSASPAEPPSTGRASRARAPASTLIIVESPTKAKTIGAFLGDGFVVRSSYGHIRDLPKGELGVDVAHHFTPRYIIPTDRRKAVTELKQEAARAQEVILATDEDREGEAIAWHLAQALELPTEKTKRIVFHEITRSAIDAALTHPRGIDMELVEAQQARRILDRLVGYTLSPFLWRKVASGLSAGRVQSVAVRVLVDREREIRAFAPEEYWTIDADLATAPGERVTAGLKLRDGVKFVPESTADADAVVKACATAPFTVTNVEEKELTKRPPAPFTTSTLQQEASRKLGCSVKQTMMLAQQLYERGHITYMRTDSVALAQEAVAVIREQIHTQFGAAYGLDAPRTYVTKSKGAQEAHEAIRPTSAARTPDHLSGELDDRQRDLYTIIWNRTMATQMRDAQLKRIAANITADRYGFRATGQTILFDGFLRLYQETREETEPRDGEEQDGEKFIPPLHAGEPLTLHTLRPEQHFTKPPPRYTEATLVKKLEEEGVGRPSTYAPTIATVQDRGYVRKEGRQLIPEEVAFMVTDLLAEHFPTIVDLQFTAKMEEDLDAIAQGTGDDTAFLEAFFTPFEQQVKTKTETLTKADVTQERVLGRDPESGLEVLVRNGRFGPYVQLGRLEDMPDLPPKTARSKPKKAKPKAASIPKGADRDTVTLAQALALLSFPRTLGEHDGAPLAVHLGRFGPYVKWGDANASIPAGIDPITVTLDDAIRFVHEAKERKQKAAEPLRILGTDTATEKAIQVKQGRYGPYVTDGTTHASVPKSSSVEAITLDEAIALLAKKRAQPKSAFRGRRRNTAPRAGTQ